MLTEEQLRVISAETLVPPAVARRISLAMEDARAADVVAAVVRLLAHHPSTASLPSEDAEGSGEPHERTG